MILQQVPYTADLQVQPEPPDRLSAHTTWLHIYLSNGNASQTRVARANRSLSTGVDDVGKVGTKGITSCACALVPNDIGGGVKRASTPPGQNVNACVGVRPACIGDVVTVLFSLVVSNVS